MTDHKRLAAESRVQRLTQERNTAAKKLGLLRAFPRSDRRYDTELMGAQMALREAERELSRAVRGMREAVEEMV